MGCKENFITMKLICYSYLVPSLGNCTHKTLRLALGERGEGELTML